MRRVFDSLGRLTLLVFNGLYFGNVLEALVLNAPVRAVVWPVFALSIGIPLMASFHADAESPNA